MFGIDELFGLDIASYYGVIDKQLWNIDVNKPGIRKLNSDGKGECCHTFLDDVVGALAAAASTRVAQIISENESQRSKLCSIPLDI